MAKSIYTDKNFKFNQLLQARVENVSSLPTGLTDDVKGYIVSFENKLYVWDGSNWQTWGSSLNWASISETIAIASVRADDFVINLDLTSDSSNNISYTYNYSDSSINPIGTISSIGKTDITDYSKFSGRRVVVSAKDGSWFNLKNGASFSSGFKAIDTLLNKDIFGVIKAEFIFNQLTNKWYLISYELLPTWYKRFTIPDSGLLQMTTISGIIPSIADNLPYNGFYQVDININVLEYDLLMARVSTEIPHTLAVASDTSNAGVFASGNIATTAEHPYPMWFNNSCQGSCILEVKNKKISWGVELLNGAINQVLGGYMHLTYLGKQEGEI